MCDTLLPCYLQIRCRPILTGSNHKWTKGVHCVQVQAIDTRLCRKISISSVHMKRLLQVTTSPTAA